MFELFKNDEPDPKNLSQALSQFKTLKKDFRKMSHELDELKQKSKISIQKIGVVRFNPFKNQGGNQSFVIALLDGNNDGVVITSLYTREENRVFGKPIKKGISVHALSGEEKKAIEMAQSSKLKTKEI